MPMVSGLIKEGTGRPLPGWVGRLTQVKSSSDKLTMNNLIDQLGVSRDSVKSVFKGLYEPDDYKIERGRSNACYLVEGLKELGRQYNDGAIYREEYKG